MAEDGIQTQSLCGKHTNIQMQSFKSNKNLQILNWYGELNFIIHWWLKYLKNKRVIFFTISYLDVCRQVCHSKCATKLFTFIDVKNHDKQSMIRKKWYENAATLQYLQLPVTLKKIVKLINYWWNDKEALQPICTQTNFSLNLVLSPSVFIFNTHKFWNELEK